MWAYIAGYIDCDGSIMKSTNNGCCGIYTYRYFICIVQHEKLEDKMKIICDFMNQNNVDASLTKRTKIGFMGTGYMVNINIKKSKKYY